MGAPPDTEFFAALLKEAIGGSMLGVHVGDEIDVLIRRFGKPKPSDIGPNLLRYRRVQFLHNDQGTIGCLYVEVPDEMVLELDKLLPDAPELVPTPDPKLWVAKIGRAQIHVDPGTRRVVSFSV